MIKFINIMEEYGANFRKDNHTAIKLDTPINRKLMDIISQKFDFDYFRGAASKWGWSSKKHIFFNRYFKGGLTNDHDLPYNNIYEFMKDSLFLDEDKINELAFLLATNLKVKDWMTDPILEPYDYYFYDIHYYDDYVSDEEEEECDTCEDCGGSGYDDADCQYCDGDGEQRLECGYCDGEGSIRDDEGDEEQCDECDGDGYEDVECDECHGNGTSGDDCYYCDGETEICNTTYYKEISEMRIKLLSPVKLPSPGEQVGNYHTDSYSDWRDKIENDEGLIVLSDEVFDTEQDDYDIDNDSYEHPFYKQVDKIKYFEETTLRNEMEEWRFGQTNHPFKTVLR
jgi:hypothetical protein